MARVKFVNGKWIDAHTGEEAPSENKFDFSRPWTGFIAADYEAYECPVSGKIIEGRKQHEENLKKTGCRILERGEKEDNVKRAKRMVEKKNREMDRAIDGIVDSVAKDIL